jgi:hypothetical protein
MTSSLIKLDWSLLPLGKLPFQPDTRDLKFSDYIDKSKLISVANCPLAHDWEAVPNCEGQKLEPDLDPLANVNAKCCVFSAPGHMVKMIGHQTNSPIIVTSDMVLDAYGISGYRLDPKLFDNGFNIRVMLKIWKLLGLYGTKALAYTLVNWRDPEELALASWLGCGTIGGFALPKASQGQVDAQGRQLWFVPPGGFPEGQGPGTWGPHAIWTCKPSPALDGGNSWGRNTYWTMEWGFECCDERWMVLVDKWQMATGRAPNGFAFNDLMSDVKTRADAQAASDPIGNFLL